MTCVNLVDGAPLAHIKGAPAETLELCTHVLANGRIEGLTNEVRRTILTEND